MNKGWSGNPSCPFCGQFETTDHLFVTCPLASTIWSWIANYNGFTYNCTSVPDLWSIDQLIPLRDSLLIELIRAATVWIIWLARNKICFNNTTIPSPQYIGSQIISLTSYWCQSRSDDTYFKLTLILPMDVTTLTQAGPHTTPLVTDTSSEEGNSWDSEEDPYRGLEGSDLSDYLRDRAEFEAMDGVGVIMISSDPSHSSSSSDNCSCADSSTTS